MGNKRLLIEMSKALEEQAAIGGAVATTFRDGDRSLDVTMRLARAERTDLSRVYNLPIATAEGAVPLSRLVEAPAALSRALSQIGLLPRGAGVLVVCAGGGGQRRADGGADGTDVVAQMRDAGGGYAC